MKRFHLHVKTDKLEESVRYYTALLGAGPVKLEADYAKWLLDDPAVNISLSTHCGSPGIDHAGLSIDTEAELEEIAGRLRRNGDAPVAEKATTCCYAQSNKYWSQDPQGARWELFQTFGESEDYGAEPPRPEEAKAGACCAP